MTLHIPPKRYLKESAGCGLLPYTQGSPTPIPQPTPIRVIDLPPSSLKVVTEVPLTMEVQHSYLIKATLTSQNRVVISSLRLEHATATASSVAVVSVGSPGASLQNAFGTGYEPRIIATITPENGSCTIHASSPTEQPLDQPEVSWVWSVMPNEVGKTYVWLDIRVQWASAGGKQLGPYFLYGKELQIETIGPTPTVAPLPSFTPTPTPLPWPSIAGSILSFSLDKIIALETGGGIIYYLFQQYLAKKRKGLSEKRKEI